MKISTYLYFDGQCEAAFKYYEQSLGGKIAFMAPYAGSPMADQVPAEWQNKIMHATLMLGDSPVMGADTPPEQRQQRQGFSLSISVEDPAQAEKIFNALAMNGTVVMPLQQTFWAARFGMLVDQFGVPWMVSC